MFGRPFAGRFVLIFKDSSANLRPASVPRSVVQVELTSPHIHPNSWEPVQSLSCGRSVPASGSYFDCAVSVKTCDCIAVQVKKFSSCVAVADSFLFVVHERSDDFFSNLSHNLWLLVV